MATAGANVLPNLRFFELLQDCVEVRVVETYHGGGEGTKRWSYDPTMSFMCVCVTIPSLSYTLHYDCNSLSGSAQSRMRIICAGFGGDAGGARVSEAPQIFNGNAKKTNVLLRQMSRS